MSYELISVVGALGMMAWIGVGWVIDERYKMAGHGTCWQANTWFGLGWVIFISLAIINRI